MNTKLILPPGLFALHLPYLHAAAAGPLGDSSGGNSRSSSSEDSRKPYAMYGGTAIISVRGAMMEGPDFWDRLFGGVTSTSMAASAFDAALADASVSSILFDFKSPGGDIAGISALAAKIRQARARKPVVAYAQDLCCSAALWLATQATEFYAGDTATIGSIGIIMGPIVDMSEALANEGVRVYYPATGFFKAAGSPGAKIEQEHLDFFDSYVASVGAHFVEDIARGRKAPVEDIRRLADGRFWVATDAKDFPLFDGIASREEVLKKMQRGQIRTNVRGTATPGGPSSNPPTSRIVTDPGKEKPPMKEAMLILSAVLAAQGFAQSAAALSTQAADEGVDLAAVLKEHLPNEMTARLQAAVDADPLRTAALTAKLDTPQKVENAAKVAAEFEAKLRTEAKGYATTLFGAQAPAMHNVLDKADFDTLSAMHAAYGAQIDAAYPAGRRHSTPVDPAAAATNPGSAELTQEKLEAARAAGLRSYQNRTGKPLVGAAAASSSTASNGTGKG